MYDHSCAGLLMEPAVPTDMIVFLLLCSLFDALLCVLMFLLIKSQTDEHLQLYPERKAFSRSIKL